MITRYAAMNLLWCVPGVGGSEEYLLRQLDGLSLITHNYQVDVFAPRGFCERHPRIAAALASQGAWGQVVTCKGDLAAVRLALDHPAHWA